MEYETTADELREGDMFAVVDPDHRWPERPATARGVEPAEPLGTDDEPGVMVRLNNATVILAASQPVKVYR